MVETASGMCELTQHIVQNCDLDSASVFLCDRAARTPSVAYLFHYQISEEVKDRYERHAVFREDPFTDPTVVERSGCSEEDGLILAADRRVQESGAGRDRYWPFMYDHGIEVVGASTRRLLPGIYATIGFHRRRDASHRGPVPLRRLATLARRLQDVASGEMLRRLVSRDGGLDSLRDSFFARPPAPANTPAAALSPREREVARLVCEGRQNKEIAFLTGLSEHTIENHLRRIYARLSIHNRSALVAAMVRVDGAGAPSVH